MPFASKITLIPRGMTTFDDAFMYGVNKFTATSLYKAPVAGGTNTKSPGTFVVLLRLDALGAGELISRWKSAVGGWGVRINGNSFQTHMYSATNAEYETHTNNGRYIQAGEVGRIFMIVGALESYYMPRIWVDRQKLIGANPQAPDNYLPGANVAQVIGGTDSNTAPIGTATIFGTMAMKGSLSVEQIEQLYLDVRNNEGFAGMVIPNPAPVGDAAIQALAPFTWFRADSFNEAGGKVTEFVDKMDAAHLYVQANTANQIPTPAPYAKLNDQLAAVFSATANTYASNKPVADWKFMSDGSPMEGFVVVSVDNIGTFGNIMGTGGSGSFNLAKALVSSTYHSIQRKVVGGNLDQSFFYRAGEATVAFRHGSGQTNYLYANDYEMNGAGGATFPTSLTPTASLTIGSPYQGQLWISDALIFNRILTDAERLTVHHYLQERYRHYGWASDVEIVDIKSVLAAQLKDAPEKQMAPKVLPNVDPNETYTLTGPGARVSRVDPNGPWNVEAVPVYRGLTDWTDNDYYVGPSGTLGPIVTAGSGWTVAALIKYNGGNNGRFFSCKSSTNGWFMQCATSGYYYWYVGPSAPTNYKAFTAGAPTLLGGTHDYSTRYSAPYVNAVGNGNFLIGAFALADVGPPRIGRSYLAGESAGTTEIFGLFYGEGVATLAQMQAQLAAVKASGRMEPIEGLTNTTLIDIHQDIIDAGGLVPATLLDRGTNGTNHFTRVGTGLKVTNIYSRFFSP